uniref:Hexosyltransferase n=1 Tax=Alexandrium monilatum TaxID=311494 RepID=A0A6T0VPH1_9DINO
MYGDNPEYALLALVLARRLATLGDRHPLLILPTPDVPAPFLHALRRAGCQVLSPTGYLWMHPQLLRAPKGRHSPVLTKLRALGLVGLKKLLLLDLDILPRRGLDALFEFRAPAAKMMPAHLQHALPLASGDIVPNTWLEVCAQTGTAGRINAGVCLLEPDPELLEYIAREVDPARELFEADGADAICDVFGALWRPSWTPEEDALTRGLRALYPEVCWTHLGVAWNYEVQGDLGYYPGLPLAEEHSRLDLKKDVCVFHFSGSQKPSWYAWHIGRGEMSIEEVCREAAEVKADEDPRGTVHAATREWLEAFGELHTHARCVWGIDVLELVGWAAPSLATWPGGPAPGEACQGPRAPEELPGSPDGQQRDRSRSRGEAYLASAGDVAPDSE